MDRRSVAHLSILPWAVYPVALLVLVAAAGRNPSASGLLDLFDKHRQVELVATGGRFLEGPVFDRSGTLWLLEVTSGYISKVDGDKVVQVAKVPAGSEPNGMALHKDGRLFVADRRLGVWSYDPKSGKVDNIVRYFHGQNFKGLNDLAFDKDGNLWFTDSWATGVNDNAGAVYFADAKDGYKTVRRVVENLAFPNGIQLSPDGTGLYVSELSQNRNWRCTVDSAQGGISSCYVATYFFSGMGPDGMKLDERGFVYQAHFNSQGVYVVSPAPGNEIVEFIRVPQGRATTNLAFKPGTKWLYITEASQNNVWRVEVDAPGLTPWGLS